MGVVRDRLARKLGASFPGVAVRPDDLTPAVGSWRTNIQLDVYRWEGFMTDEYGTRRFIGSYQTMTDLVKCKRLVRDRHGEVFGTDNDDD